MNSYQPYEAQVKLLLDILPVVEQAGGFALKGGTAINLFLQNMPRYSVDIDLTYMLVEPRAIFLSHLTEKLNELSTKIKAAYPRLHTQKHYTQADKQLYRLSVSNDEVTIKIEPNLTLRGTLFDTQTVPLCKVAQEKFLQGMTVRLLSTGEIYAGKLCAALDRQHPRDLFDVKILLDEQGITPDITKAFVVYLASSPRPMHELLNPNRKLDQKSLFEKQFAGMTTVPITYPELEKAREKLFEVLHNTLTNEERQFLISVKQGEPNWVLLDLDEKNFNGWPAILWKVQNIKKMDQKKHQLMLDELKKVLDF